ncbi:MAG: SDR family oxidoreductase [Proteobacteria bacterium]|nr:SDR family oxidoreductase [Pseudomonadota bacterium]
MSTTHITHAAPTQGRLTGKVVLVTGAGSGIGRAAALAFGRQGASVVLAGRRAPELNAVAHEIIAANGSAVAIPADVSDEGAIEALINSINDRFGQFDAAFNNAGVASSFAPITDLSVEDFDRTMAVNTRGVWLLMKHEIKAMLAQGTGGVIVNTSSIAATGGTAGLSIYAASKGAIDSMIRPVALEVGPAGIRVNNVSPSLVKTPMTSGYPDAALAPVAAHAALKRVGEPEDIADVAVWLCTDEARFVTGQSILVDGGFNIAGAR